MLCWQSEHKKLPVFPQTMHRFGKKESTTKSTNWLTGSQFCNVVCSQRRLWIAPLRMGSFMYISPFLIFRL